MTKLAVLSLKAVNRESNIGGGRGGAGGTLAPPPLFCRWYFFFTCEHPAFQTKSRNQMQNAANIAFDLFNIFLYVIARKVRKCPLSPFLASNVVLSCLVRMEDVLAQLVQKADSLSALRLTGALWSSLSNTPTPPPPPLLDRSVAPVKTQKVVCLKNSYQD